MDNEPTFAWVGMGQNPGALVNGQFIFFYTEIIL